MALSNVTFEIPNGKMLSCLTCGTTLKNVANAIEHTVVCRKKIRLANKHQRVDQLDKIRGQVRWTRSNISHLLSLLKKKSSEVGKAKAYFRTSELGKVNREIASELADIIGSGVTSYLVRRKWTQLQKRSSNYDALRKNLLAKGFYPPDPPSFHPSVKEIMRCIEEERIKYVKKMENSEESYLLKIDEEEMEVSQETCNNKDVSFEIPIEAEDESCKISQIEGGGSGSMIIKRNTVLRIISHLEEGMEYSGIMKEFDISESVLSAIDQNRETIAQGAQRCSLCHILLSTQDDVVAHETDCCKIAQPSFKEIPSLSEDEDASFEGFLPETTDQLVDIVLKWYPKFTKGVNWNKVAAHLSVMQSGMNPTRCRHKWHNLVARCRKYRKLDNWVKKHNYSHDNPPPRYYDRLIPYAESCLKFEPSEDSIQKFMSIGTYSNMKASSLAVINVKKLKKDSESECDGEMTLDSNDEETCAEEEGSIINISSSANHDGFTGVEAEENNIHSDDHPSEENSETSSLRLSETKVDMESDLQHNRKERKNIRLRIWEHDTKSQLGVATDGQDDHMKKIETKLDEVLGLLSDVMKENRRLTSEAEKRSREKNSQEQIANKLEKLSNIFVTTHRQSLNYLQSMAQMWERHHQEHQTVIKSLISEITGKRNVEDTLLKK